MNQSKHHILWHRPDVPARFRTGVSLHSHTMYSSENLAMIPRYASKVPFFYGMIQAQARRYFEKTGHKLDFGRAFWTPPLHPRDAYKLERLQLENKLDVNGLVSLSDHDNIEAGSLLAMVDKANAHPISVEWTV